MTSDKDYLPSSLAGVVSKQTQEQFTIGKVVDTNDPQQMGRVRAICPAFGDDSLAQDEDVLWAMYVSPLGGVVNMGKRGHEESSVYGPTAYGMWSIPKVGAYVLVGCLDGDSSLRFYVGCIQPQYMTHSMPHGRFIWNDKKAAAEIDGLPDGPLDSFEQPINPLYEKLEDHFFKVDRTLYYAEGTPEDPRRNMEWRTRGADMMVSAVTTEQTKHAQDGTGTSVADHNWDGPGFESTKFREENNDEKIVKGPGYTLDQQEPDDGYEYTGGVNYDSSVYSWTTPGFHSIAMDDRHDNTRIRIRTTSGHQIILDDTNERVYVSTAGGETWIELDQVGNIDIYASKNISTHAAGDINFTTQKTFRVQAAEGFHIHSKKEGRIHTVEDFHVRSDANIRSKSGSNTQMESGNIFSVRASGSLLLTSDGGSVDVNAGMCVDLTSASHTNILAGGSVFITGSEVHLNGPPAEAAGVAGPAGEKHSFWTSRVPEHEPWGRMFMDLSADQDSGNQHVLEFPYTDQMVGKGSTARNESYERNKRWHR